MAPRAWESAPFPIGLAARAGLDTVPRMCRNIRTLANFAPPATAAEIRASSLQFVRKLVDPRSDDSQTGLRRAAQRLQELTATQGQFAGKVH